MKELVRVHAKAQNRCALGIMHAYMLIYPKSTLADLRRAFPNELNPDKGVSENFVYAEDKGTTANWDGFFKADDELLNLGDGKQASLVKMWTKPNFERLVKHAEKYGIVVASFEEADKGFGKKGGYYLEYLNGFTPTPNKKKAFPWLWIIIALLAIILFFVYRGCSTEVVPEPVPAPAPVVEKVEEPIEEIVTQVEEIEQKFNALLFNKGEAVLRPGNEETIERLAKLLKENAKIKLQVEGHASSEGDLSFNETLAQKRAEAIVSALKNLGIETNRLEAIGKGISEPVSDNPEKNRRVELVIIK